MILFFIALNILTLLHSLEQTSTTESEADQVYRTNPVLKYSKIPLKAPLLPLPYGQSRSSREFNLERIFPSALLKCVSNVCYKA